MGYLGKLCYGLSLVGVIVLGVYGHMQMPPDRTSTLTYKGRLHGRDVSYIESPSGNTLDIVTDKTYVKMVDEDDFHSVKSPGYVKDSIDLVVVQNLRSGSTPSFHKSGRVLADNNRLYQRLRSEIKSRM